MLEKVAPDAAITLTETVLGSAVVLLIVLLFVVLKLVFKHMHDSDKRWSQSLDKNTDALKGITDVQKESGDKIAVSIERALLYSRNHNDNGNPRV